MVLGAALVLGAATGWLWPRRDFFRAVVAYSGREAGELNAVSIDEHVSETLDDWVRGSDRGVRLAIFGDSTFDCQGGVELGALLPVAFSRARRSIGVVTFAFPAGSARHFLYLLDRVLAGHPNLVIVEVNPRSLQAEWINKVDWRLPQLSRWLSWRHAIAFDPELAVAGVGPLDPWIYRIEERLGLLYVLDGLRLMVEDRLIDLGLAVSLRLGYGSDSGPRQVGPRPSLSVRETEQAWAHYGNEPAGNATASALRLVARVLHEAGVPVLFYVTPINVENLAELGIADALDLPGRLERLRRVVDAAPPEWLDLHALVPKSEFRDFAEHLVTPGCMRLAEALAKAAMERLAHRPAGS